MRVPSVMRNPPGVDLCEYSTRASPGIPTNALHLVKGASTTLYPKIRSQKCPPASLSLYISGTPYDSFSF